jgi:hypothetical protein
MQLGLFTPGFGRLPLDAMLVELKRYPQVKMLEIGTGRLAWSLTHRRRGHAR